MFSLLRRKTTHRKSVYSSLPYAASAAYTCKAGGLEWSWPIASFLAILLGFTFAGQDQRDSLLAGLQRISDVVLRRAAAQSPELDRVLIVTANTKQQLNVIATLSPRGIDPLLAQNGRDVRTMLDQSASRIRFAVLDESLPDSAAIARKLRDSLPGNRVIILKAGSGADTIGPLLMSYL
jgi:hypothetical protein